MDVDWTPLASIGCLLSTFAGRLWLDLPWLAPNVIQRYPMAAKISFSDANYSHLIVFSGRVVGQSS